MTVASGDSSDIAPYDPKEFGDTGLEDVTPADLMIPRLRIVHDEATFEDSLSKTRYETMRVVLLGLVKQRVMWHEDVDEGDVPQCKSPNFDYGFPNLRDDIRKEKRFPWAKSNFDPGMAAPVEVEASKAYPEGWSSNGLPVLTCSACIFQKWDQGDWKQPPCSEQHTYPLLYSPDGDDYNWVAALFTIQKTGIKPSRSYINSFAQSNNPMFTVYTDISLTQQSRGSVKYSVPVFKRGPATDREDWREYAQRQRQIRTFIRQAPWRTEEEEAVPIESDNKNTAPTAADDPWASSAAPEAAAAAVPATTAAPTATGAGSPPVPVAVPPKTATAAPPAAATNEDDDDIPF